MNRRQPKSMGLILMTRQELLNASLQPSLLVAGWNDEMWGGRKMDASSATPESYAGQRAHLLNDSPPTTSSFPFTLTSNSPPLCLYASPWPWCNDRPLNYPHRLIAADCNCCELFRLCWNCSLNGRETERERYCGSNKLHALPTWSISLFWKQQLWSLTVSINEAEQETASSYLVLW